MACVIFLFTLVQYTGYSSCFKMIFLSICWFVLIINSFLSHIHFSQTRSCLFNLQNVLKNPTRRISCFKFFKSTYLFVKVWLLKYWSFLRWHVGRIDWNVRFFFTNSSVDKVQYIFHNHRLQKYKWLKFNDSTRFLWATSRSCNC